MAHRFRGLSLITIGIQDGPPEFLPTEEKGILFLDELNMAPPAKGMAKLILDRKVGSYSLPDEWLVWSAKQERSKASVFEIPAPLSNRFIH